MNYLIQLMRAEREFAQLAKIKKLRSKDRFLSKFYRLKNWYEYLKCHAEQQDYLREIEEMAEEQFPLHLEITIQELLQTPST